MLKPFFVELKTTIVVMAENPLQATLAAELNAQDVCLNGEIVADGVTELESLQGLGALEGGWNGDSTPYGSNVPLKNLLPETPPFKDTKTIDMFRLA